jgi:hypothetical protein
MDNQDLIKTPEKSVKKSPFSHSTKAPTNSSSHSTPSNYERPDPNKKNISLGDKSVIEPFNDRGFSLTVDKMKNVCVEPDGLFLSIKSKYREGHKTSPEQEMNYNSGIFTNDSVNIGTFLEKNVKASHVHLDMSSSVQAKDYESAKSKFSRL